MSANTITPNVLDDLTKVVETVASIQRDFDTAQSKEEEASLALLNIVLTRAKAGLRSICHYPLIEYCHSKYYRTKWCGIRIAGEEIPESYGGRDDPEGTYSGLSLWLRPDLTLAEIKYEGKWSRYRGRGEYWEGNVKIYEDVTKAIIDGWDIDPEYIAEFLSKKFYEFANGKAPEQTKQILKRAERLACIASLA